MNLSAPARLVVPLGTALTTSLATGRSADNTVGRDPAITTTTVATSSLASEMTMSARLLIGEWRHHG